MHTHKLCLYATTVSMDIKLVTIYYLLIAFLNVMKRNLTNDSKIVINN